MIFNYVKQKRWTDEWRKNKNELTVSAGTVSTARARYFLMRKQFMISRVHFRSNSKSNKFVWSDGDMWSVHARDPHKLKQLGAHIKIVCTVIFIRYSSHLLLSRSGHSLMTKSMAMSVCRLAAHFSSRRHTKWEFRYFSAQFLRLISWWTIVMARYRWQNVKAKKKNCSFAVNFRMECAVGVECVRNAISESNEKRKQNLFSFKKVRGRDKRMATAYGNDKMHPNERSVP